MRKTCGHVGAENSDDVETLPDVGGNVSEAVGDDHTAL